MKKIFFGIIYCMFLLFVCGCTASKKLGYLQALSADSTLRKLPLAPAEALRMQPGDQLEILVTSISPEATLYFNTSPTEIATSSTGHSNTYLVTEKGFIQLPLLGALHIEGKTLDMVRQLITDSVSIYLREPVVRVRLTNFKVSVIGEVKEPKVIPVDGERINIFEALAASGDLTEFAKRHNVKVMRQQQGTSEMEVGNLNLNSTDITQSKFFNLKQNDVIYIEPYTTKAFNTEVATRYIPLAVSIVTILILLSGRIK